MGRNADAVAEGLQIAWAAARLTVKNIILVDTIAHGADFDADGVARRAQEVLRELAREQQDAADLVRRQRRRAWGRFSEPDGTHDYRDRDTRNLRRRQRQYAGVAKALHAQVEDPETVGRLVEEAREGAWADVEGNLARRLTVEGMRADADPEYAALREARMSAVAMIDLQRLEAHQRALGHLPRVAPGDSQPSDP